MIDKNELKVLTQKVAKNIYKETVSHDPLNQRLVDINVALAPLVRIIKEQQRQFDELKIFVGNRYECHRDISKDIEDIHGDDPCSKYNYHDGHRVGKIAGKESAYKTVMGEMKK
jgi:hypothetical protein